MNSPAAPRRRPRRLVPGDRVAVVAPSGPVEPDRLSRGCDVLRGWGFEVVMGQHALARTGYLAGTDAERAADFRRAWLDPSIAAVVCARGGYGATRLLDRIDWAELSTAAPKVLVGSSDVTALHQAVGERLGLVSLFGPMAATVAFAGGPGPGADERTARHLRDTLDGAPESVVLRAANPVEVVPGAARGVTTGGTLSLLAALAGTPYAGSADGAIVFVEDVGESPYRLDRLLTQLRQAGWFTGVRGVVLGSWTGCGDGAAEVLAERLGDLGVPVLGGLPAGHGPTQLTVPLGAHAMLDTRAGTLVLDRPALG